MWELAEDAKEKCRFLQDMKKTANAPPVTLATNVWGYVTDRQTCERCKSRQVVIGRKGYFCRSCGHRTSPAKVRCGCGKILLNTKQTKSEADRAHNRKVKKVFNMKYHCTGIHL